MNERAEFMKKKMVFFYILLAPAVFILACSTATSFKWVKLEKNPKCEPFIFQEMFSVVSHKFLYESQ